MSSAQVLQEYLVKCGFQTDEVSLRKFEDGLGKTGKKVFAFGAGVAGMVAAVEVATAAFAYSMRKMYFQAELSGTSVKNMKAMEFAGKQIGVSGESIDAATHSLAQLLRLNPGMQSYVNGLTGVNQAGRDTADTLLDLVDAVHKQFPQEFVGARVMEQFGIDPDTYHLMITHFAELKKARQEALRIQKESGVDLDKQKATMLEYTHALDALSLRFDSFASRFLASMSPAFSFTTTWLGNIIEGWTYIFSSDAEKKAMLQAKKPKRELSEPEKLDQRIMAGEQVGDPSKLPPRRATPTDPIGLFQSFGWTKEQAAGIVANLQAESQLNPNAMGDFDKEGVAQAYGLAQWHPDRQQRFKEYAGKDIRDSTYDEQAGFVDYELRNQEKKAGNLLSGAKTADEAARIMDIFYERSKNKDSVDANMRGALATRLLDNRNAATINVAPVTTINVVGSEARAIAKEVAKAQTRVTADTFRNLKGMAR